jgi:hypothetical protein
MSKLSNRVATLAVMSTLAIGTVAAAPAYAKGVNVATRGTCTTHSLSKLKLGHDLKVIETGFEVDSNRVGQVWKVAITDNGVSVFSGSRTTTAPSGSFTVARRIPDRAGLDNVVATATNPATGESCVARASI